MEPIRLCIIGSGWRAAFFLRCAAFLPERFRLCGVVTTNARRKAEYEQAFNVTVYDSMDALFRHESPEYAVVSVAARAAAEVTERVLNHAVPVLLETPASLALWGRISAHAPVQIAEQYFLRPMEQARLNLIAQGLLGNIVQARVSFCNDYHAVSLLRKYLGVGFHNCRITALEMNVPGYPGYERDSLYLDWELKDRRQVIAALDFDGRVGLFDYETMQHRSFIRSQFTQLKGAKGENMNSDIRYLTAPNQFMQSSLIRQNMGDDVNIEGFGLKGITGNGLWLYENPYLNSRLTDDEIAVAQCMERMGAYVRGGEGFYSLNEGMQDMYLSALIEKAARTGAAVTSETQAFAL